MVFHRLLHVATHLKRLFFNRIHPHNNTLPALPEVTLWPAQQQLVNPPQLDPLVITFYQGGVGCGKTFGACYFGIQQAMAQPYTTGLVLSKYNATWKDTVLPLYELLLNDAGYHMGEDVLWLNSEKTLLFANGSKIMFRCVNKNSSPLPNNVTWIHVEDADNWQEQQFTRLQALLRQTQAQQLHLLATYQPPDNPRHWLYSWVYCQPVCDYVHVRTIKAPTAENEALPLHYAERMAQIYADSPWKVTGEKAEDLTAEPLEEDLQAEEVLYQQMLGWAVDMLGDNDDDEPMTLEHVEHHLVQRAEQNRQMAATSSSKNATTLSDDGLYVTAPRKPSNAVQSSAPLSKTPRKEKASAPNQAKPPNRLQQLAQQVLGRR